MRAVDEVDMDVATGETLAVMGAVIPARMGARQPVAEILQAEAA